MINTLACRILQKEMNQLKDLACHSQPIRILDHEKPQKMIGDIFRRVKEATKLFHCSFPVCNDEQHPGNGEHDTRRRQGKYLGFLAVMTLID